VPRVGIYVESIVAVPRDHVSMHVGDLLAGYLSVRQQDVDTD
jgi:hypothetical protein